MGFNSSPRFSSRGRGRGRGRGGFRGGRGGGRRRGREPTGIVLELGEFMHSTPKQMIFKSVMKDNVPMFHQSILNSKTQGADLGKIDEIFG